MVAQKVPQGNWHHFFTGSFPFSLSFPHILTLLSRTLPHKLLWPKSCLSEEKMVFRSSSVWLFVYIFIWLCWVFTAAHRLCSSWGEWGSSLVGVQGPVIAGACLVEHRLSNCGEWAQLPHSMWNLPRPGIQPVSPEWAGGFLTSGPQGSPIWLVLPWLNPLLWKAGV